MKSLDFSAPTGVFFGNGELRRLQEMLLAAKQTMKQTGILDGAEELLREGRVDVVSEDPNLQDVDLDRQTSVFLTRKCDVASGLGAGSSTDSAKAVVSRADLVSMCRDSL